MRLYSDNARAFFSAGITNSDLTFSCSSGLGALFPSPTSADYFIATFESADKTKIEKVKVVSKSTDTFTIAGGGRGQEGTTAQSWTTADTISVRWTSASNTLLIQSNQFNTNKYSSTETGTSAAYVITIDPSPVAYAAGLEVTFKATNINIGTCTANVNGIGAVAIKKYGNIDLSPGDILANQIVTLQHDGTFWQIMSQIPSERAGRIALYAGSNLHTGWFRCDGAAVSRTTYSTLFAVIGTIYGAGDGSTTFNLPDFRGRVPVGEGAGAGLTNRALGSKAGEENHILTVSELAPHTHPADTVGSLNVASAGYYGQPAAGSVATNTGSTGSGSGHNTMQPFLTVQYFIKA